MTTATTRTVPLLLAALLLGTACSDDATRTAEHLEAAKALQDEGKPAEARIELKSALRIDPTNAEINLLLGQSEMALGNASDALFSFEEAWRLEPGSIDAGLGIIGIEAFGDLERAKAVSNELAEKHPAEPRVHIALSNIALAEGDTESALVSALTAVELGPADPKTHFQRGVVHASRIREARLKKQEIPDELYDEAAGSFRRARELADTSSLEGRGLRTRTWIEEARTHARARGQQEQVRSVLAAGLEDLHDAPEELRRKLIETSLQIGRQKRDRELVRWSLERTVELDPSDYAAWGDLATLAERADGSGRDVVERLIAARPDDPRAHAMYARMVALAGDPAAAVAHLEKVASTLEGDVSPVLQPLVALKIQQGEIEQAKAIHEDMAQRFPDSGPTFRAGAELASAEGDLTLAVAELTRWRNLRENRIALRMLAQVELSRGNGRAALEAADAALALAKAEREQLKPYLCIRGQALQRQGDQEAALRTLMNASRSPGPQVEGCQEALVAALFASGREEPGRKLLARLLERAPSRTAVMQFHRYQGQEDPARARALLDEHLAKVPDDPGALTRLVQLDLAEGDNEAAVARARRAQEQFPDSAEFNVLLGRTLATAGQTEPALAVLEDVLERWPSAARGAEMYFSLLSRLGRLDEARETFERMEAEGSLAPGAHVMLARMRIRSGDDAGGQALLEKVLDENPGLPTAANDLAYLLARTGGDLNRATDLAQEARGREPESPQIADTLGWVLYKRGLTDAALVQFDEAIALSDPQSSAWATANYHRGIALLELGRNEKALEAMERAIASGAEFPEAAAARAAIQDIDQAAG